MNPGKTILRLAVLLVLSASSCVVSVDPYGPIGYYSVLPDDYIGDYYWHGGRYYYGGVYESGRFHYRGNYYDGRYLHNGHYIYGGRHDHHMGRGHHFR